MKKKNNISTNYGKLKGRLNRYDINGAYNFNENKNNKNIANNSVHELKSYRNEENCNSNNYNNTSSIGHMNANINYNNGNNNYYMHNFKYNKNSYSYDYNSFQAKKAYDYKEKFKNSNHNNNAFNNNSLLENRNNIHTVNSSNITNQIIKENNDEKNQDDHDHENKNKKSNEEENINEEVSLLREKICFKMLKSIDAYITKIIMKSCFVTVYKMKEDELKWTRADIEGFLYIVRRSINPFYRLIITNKKNEKHLLQDIDSNINLSTDQNYIFYRTLNEENNSKSIYSLWFYSTEEKEKIYNVLKELVEKAFHEKNNLDNINRNNNNNTKENNSNKNVNYILTKNSSINDNSIAVRKTEENIKNLNNMHKKNEDNKVNKNINLENNNNNNKDNNNDKDNDCNNNFTTIKSNSTTDDENESNLDLVHNMNDKDPMKMNIGNDNMLYDNYMKNYYNINSNNNSNKNINSKKNISDAIEDLNNHNTSNKKEINCNKNNICYNEKAGKKLLYLIKGISTEYDKENENTKLLFDEYCENNNCDAINHNQNKIEEKSNYYQNEINAKKGGEAIMSLLGLSKNNELKEKEEIKKKKKGKNTDNIINNSNVIMNYNLKKNEKQSLLNNSKNNIYDKTFKYYKSKHDSNEEFSVNNKIDRKNNELINNSSFEIYKNKNKENLNNNNNNNNNNNYNAENDILNSYNTDSYNILLKMQSKIENDDKKIINILDNKTNQKKNSCTKFSDNKDQIKYDNTFDSSSSDNKINNIDYRNKSITLNQSKIHNIIKETLQSDEFVDLLWKNLTMNKNFT